MFDSYRQGFQHQKNYECDWNGKSGWLKLAHVCRNWRLIVLTSPNRLHLRFMFTARTPTTALKLNRLSPLPIFVNFREGARTHREQGRMISALKNRTRVWGINFRGTDAALQILLWAMDRPFPALQSLQIYRDQVYPKFYFPTTYLQNSAPDLRHLSLCGAPFSSLSRLLSTTTGLTDLSLSIDTNSFLLPAASLLTYLQGMPLLRRLELDMWYLYPSTTITNTKPSITKENIVRLSKLTYLRLSGHGDHLEGLLAGLVAPSLQDFHARVGYINLTFPFLRLARFISATERSVSAVDVTFTSRDLHISMLHSINSLSFRLEVPDTMVSTARMSSTLSATLNTVEDLLLPSVI
jgi:hypothetical protein